MTGGEAEVDAGAGAGADAGAGAGADDEQAKESLAFSELSTGWGRGSTSLSSVVHVTEVEALASTVSQAAARGRGVLARGLGRSYGDAAQCAGGTLIDCTGLDSAGLDSAGLDGAMGIPTSAELAGQSLVLDVGSGVSIDALLRRLIPKGWFVPVTPGTAYVTLGGAIAADVHGKNHHRDGAFGSHVEQLTLVSADGPRELSPQRDPAMFWATVGGMGLTGVIARARVRLRAIESSSMTVDTLRASDLDACMAILAEADERYRYSVAWVDCSARGSRFGRSVVSLGEHATIDELPVNRRSSPREYVPGAVTRLPVSPPRNLVTRAAITAANEAWFRKAPRQRSGEVQTVRSFFYPLDALGGWNRLYGRRGFTQYQIVVPFGCEGVIAAVIARLQAAGMPSSLGVLKRFGASDDAPLSFPRPGWTLALDLAITPGLAAVLDELDELVARAEGRVYLAKDGRVRPELLQVMYPRIGEWLDVRDELDPGSVFVSDMWRRLCAGVGRDR